MATMTGIAFSLALLGVLPEPGAGAEGSMRADKLRIDHLMVGIGDLDQGVVQFEHLTGVRPAAGGDHPGRGTRNALAALGDGRYLEIIAAQSGAAASPTVDALRKLTTLTPIGWAVSTSDPAATARRLREAGYGVSDPTPGSRVKPDGTKLEWVTFEITAPKLEEAPFFIAWNPKSVHPSSDSPAGCSLTGVTLQMTQPDRRLLDLLALGVEARRGEGARMVVTLHCPKGTVRIGEE